MRVDYYELLDAPPTASRRELHAAYLRMAKRFHPDKNAADPDAEERFKLVVEAWRTLGDAEKRADYDAWLERHRRFSAMPELEGMHRRVRVSARRGEERRRAAAESRRRPQRGRYMDGAARYVRPFLLRPRGSKVSGLSYVLFGLLFLASMVSYLSRRLDAEPAQRKAPADSESTLAFGESPLSAEDQARQLANFARRVQVSAEAGDAAAQYRYGFLLYMGLSGLEVDKEAAMKWWRQSAAQGYPLAQKVITSMHEKHEAGHERRLPPGGAEAAAAEPQQP